MERILEMMEHLNRSHDVQISLSVRVVTRKTDFKKTDWIEWAIDYCTPNEEGLVDEGEVKFFDKFAMGTVEEQIADALDDFDSQVHEYETDFEDSQEPEYSRPDWDIADSNYR